MDPLPLLLLILRLKFPEQGLRLELALVVRLCVDGLVIEALPEDLLSLIAPDFLPLALLVRVSHLIPRVQIVIKERKSNLCLLPLFELLL